MGAFIEEKKFKIKIVHVISLILVLVFIIGVYGFTMTNFKYHRRIFGNRYTYTVIEEKNMHSGFRTFLEVLLVSDLEIHEEYTDKIDGNSLIESFDKIEKTFLKYLPDDVVFSQGELTLASGILITADEYTFQNKGDNLQSMVIEILEIIRDDEKFYYMLKGLEPYIQFNELTEISNPQEFWDHLDARIKKYKNTDFVEENYQLYQTSLVNNKGKIIYRMMVFSRTKDGIGETMLYYAGGYHEKESKFDYTLNIKDGEEKIKITGDYSVNNKKISGFGNISKEGMHTIEFTF